MIIELVCPRCGATTAHLPEALIAVCEFCGAVTAGHRAAIGGAYSLAAAYQRSWIAPTAIDARRFELELAVRDTHSLGDRRAWRLAVREQALLELGGLAAADPAAARWLAVLVAAREITDWELAPSPGRAVDAVALAADPVGVARALLTTARRDAAAIFDHPHFPVELRGDALVDAHARDVVRASLVAIAPFSTRDAIGAAFAAAFPPRRPGAPCHTCGGPVDAAAIAPLRCPWCSRPIEHDVDDLWLEVIIGQGQVATAGILEVTARRDTAQRLLDAHLGVDGGTGRADLAERYFAAVLGPREERPLPDDATWVRAQRALWRLWELGARGEPATTAMGQLLMARTSGRVVGAEAAADYLRAVGVAAAGIDWDWARMTAGVEANAWLDAIAAALAR